MKKELSPTINHWAKSVVNISQLDQKRLRARLIGLGTIMSISSLVAFAAIAVFALGIPATESDRFLVLSVLLLSILLIFASAFMIAQILWGAFVFERASNIIMNGFRKK